MKLISLYKFKKFRKEWTDEVESVYGVRPGKHRMCYLLAVRLGFRDYDHYRRVLKESLNAPIGA